MSVPGMWGPRGAQVSLSTWLGTLARDSAYCLTPGELVGPEC